MQEVVFIQEVHKSGSNLGVTLDKRLTLEVHFRIVLNKTNRTIGLVRKSQSQNLLPRKRINHVQVPPQTTLYVDSSK